MISFVRIDDRMIHGQTVTRWSLESPCDGTIAVNEDHFKESADKVLASKTRYFLITKNPLDMKELLVDFGFKPSDVKRVIVGPCNDRPNTVKLGNNQSITAEEAQAFEDMTKAGYTVEFALIKEASIGEWPKFRGQFNVK